MAMKPKTSGCNYNPNGNDHDDYSQRTTSSPTVPTCYNYIYNHNENYAIENWLLADATTND